MSANLFYSADKLLMVTFFVYLLGCATPVVLLRMLAKEQEDNCFLTAILILLSFLLLILLVGLVSY